jgi:hypothetical protein
VPVPLAFRQAYHPQHADRRPCCCLAGQPVLRTYNPTLLAAQTDHAMFRQSLALLLVVSASAPSRADNCDSIRDQVEAKFKAGGTLNFSVKVVDAGAVGNARVVGSCGNGTRRIVFVPGDLPNGPAASPRAATPQPPPILTECKDGSISHTGNCRKP